MDKELLGLLMSPITALLAVIIAPIVTWIAAKRAMSAGFGSQEMQDISIINELQREIINCQIEIKQTKEDELKKLYDDKLDILKNQYFNMYEVLCARYLANKIDRKNFKEMYGNLILRLVKHHKDDYGIDSEFKATIAVYKEFEENTKSCGCRFFCFRYR